MVTLVCLIAIVQGFFHVATVLEMDPGDVDRVTGAIFATLSLLPAASLLGMTYSQ